VRAGNIVQDEGQASRLCDRLEMHQHALLHWLVVIGHDRKHSVGAGCLGTPGEPNGMPGRVGDGAGDNPTPTTGDIDRGADDQLLLGRRQCRGLARRLADHERGNTGRDLALAE
jgi:hypothetical protein